MIAAKLCCDWEKGRYRCAKKKNPESKNTLSVKCTREEKRAHEHKLREDGEVRGGKTIVVKDWGGGC